MGFPDRSVGKESTCNAGDLGSIPELGRSPGKGKGYPLQYSGLENSTDYIVHGVAESWVQLSDFHFHFPRRERRGRGGIFCMTFTFFPRHPRLERWGHGGIFCTTFTFFPRHPRRERPGRGGIFCTTFTFFPRLERPGVGEPSACRCTAVPAPSKTLFFPQEGSWHLCWNQMTLNLRAYFHTPQ